jgi:formylglycine-generating enzyme required for sulfatase activity
MSTTKKLLEQKTVRSVFVLNIFVGFSAACATSVDGGGASGAAGTTGAGASGAPGTAAAGGADGTSSSGAAGAGGASDAGGSGIGGSASTATSGAGGQPGAGGVSGAAGAGGSSGTAGAGGSSGAGGGDSGACAQGMVHIASMGKSFTMGLDPNEAPLQGNGQPWACYLGKHQVTFSYDYCVDSKLVTQAEFAALMGFNPSAHKTNDPTLPVDSESWYDAVLYCNKKSQKDSLQAAYSYGAVTLNGMSASNLANVALDIKKNGYRLMTNAEYEYAERADTIGWYFFSPTLTANITALGAVYAWYAGNSGGVSQPVGTLKPNPWGLYDIVGNLFEWEHDWEGPYVTTPEVDPTGPAMPSDCSGKGISGQRMAKGGSWHTDVGSHMRIGYHFRWGPASNSAELGFRCARTLN